MPKVRVFTFVKNNVVERTNPPIEVLHQCQADPNCVLIYSDEELKGLAGVPRQFWKLEGGKMYPMTAAERNQRRVDIEKDGIHNTTPFDGYTPEQIVEVVKESIQERVLPIKEVVYKTPKSTWVSVALNVALIAYLIAERL